MAIEVSKLTPNQQNELADALLAYHLVDPPLPADALQELPTQLDTTKLPRCVFVPPKEELESWPKELPMKDNVAEISRLTVYVLSLWREACLRKNHSPSKTHWDGAQVARITRSSELRELNNTEVIAYSTMLGLVAETENGKASWSVKQIIAMVIARKYCKGKGGLTSDHKKAIGGVIKFHDDAAAYLDERKSVGKPAQRRTGSPNGRLR